MPQSYIVTLCLHLHVRELPPHEMCSLVIHNKKYINHEQIHFCHINDDIFFLTRSHIDVFTNTWYKLRCLQGDKGQSSSHKDNMCIGRWKMSGHRWNIEICQICNVYIQLRKIHWRCFIWCRYCNFILDELVLLVQNYSILQL